jgi:hypothetical protein
LAKAPKIGKSAENWQKRRKLAKAPKIGKSAENCDHTIGPRIDQAIYKGNGRVVQGDLETTSSNVSADFFLFE